MGKAIEKIGITILLLMVGSVCVNAQGDKPQINLLENPSFELQKGTLKKNRQIKVAQKWASTTGVLADLFSSNISPNAVVYSLDNMYGREVAFEGAAYAGITVYGFGRKLLRSYITTPLDGNLKVGKKYCVSMRISLSDLSKYASNNIGITFTRKNPIIEGKKNMYVTDFLRDDEGIVRDRNNKIYTKQYGWDKLCEPYTAKGKESFLSIGNFHHDQKTETQVMSKPKHINKNQIPISYYYIDEVKVIEIEKEEDCVCKDAERGDKDIIFSEQRGIRPEMELQEKLKRSTIYFADFKTNLVNNAQHDLNKMAKWLIENPISIDVIGHSDDLEDKLSYENPEYVGIAKRRAETIVAHLITQGVPKERFNIVYRNSLEPKVTGKTPAARSQNRRVEFKIH